MPDPHLSLESALEQLQRIQKLHPHRDWRLVIRRANPGGLTAHQTTEVQGLFAGFDWEAGQVVIEPANPLTELTAAQVKAIQKSVRAGTSWHSLEREKKLRDRIQALEAEVALLRGQAPPQA